MKPKITTLKLNKEFKRAYYKGSFKAHPFLVTYMVKSRVKAPRMGITTAKKVGNAVLRNRAKRIIRQAYRELLAEELIIPLKSGYDFVFVARSDTPKQKSHAIKAVMRKQIAFLSTKAKGL